jgi:hypothetical protein
LMPNVRGGRFAELSLPLGGAEAQCLSILGDCAFGLVLGTIGERRFDFDADFDYGIGVGGKYRNDFFGDLHEAHLGLEGRFERKPATALSPRRKQLNCLVRCDRKWEPEEQRTSSVSSCSEWLTAWLWQVYARFFPSGQQGRSKRALDCKPAPAIDQGIEFRANIIPCDTTPVGVQSSCLTTPLGHSRLCRQLFEHELQSAQQIIIGDYVDDVLILSPHNLEIATLLGR